MDKIKLPEPVNSGMMLEEALKRRRSLREYSGKEPGLQEISNLLWACQGVTDSINGFRTSPSAGATYPLVVYLLWRNTLYRYEPETHSIYRVEEDTSLKKKLFLACLSQEWVYNAPLVFVITAVPERTMGRYGERAWRYIYIEAGHACQNLLLEAEALGMGGVPVGAFYDDEVKEVLGIDETPIYVIPAGFR